MSIYITKSVQFATKVEAFEKRGLSGQVSCKASEGGIFPLSARSVTERIRFTRLAEELQAGKDKTAALYSDIPSFHSVLQDLPLKGYEKPTLFVEMKSV